MTTIIKEVSDLALVLALDYLYRENIKIFEVEKLLPKIMGLKPRRLQRNNYKSDIRALYSKASDCYRIFISNLIKLK